MSDQDWNTVVLNKKKPKGNNKQQVRQAQRTGAGVTTVNKGAGNKQRRGPDNYAKVDHMDEADRVKTVSIDVAKTIQRARLDKGWTQKELGQKINEQARVIQEYESGKAIPNQQVLGKLERVLGVKLRGKKKA
mmetsp:Transcript_28481/g.79652  ORF Transcript_28481/g.79652 Transcript_28481/m.79652 type:complete len:133 (+) Transcript_28481:226-624(+)|eukprot:CAMPEP_0119120292 /NCGR_PEP_ID=MMETSP1310-20130426/1395_1 /TAXON_ID=464262 /ORGANISM="Genus nov. species nov., Strain RCC2339" /LENGTH=132 /DNA_ID=CAMNT_0007109761 /DNA_START=239 /DNA_END=637 /DNA_ORIENTATION=-